MNKIIVDKNSEINTIKKAIDLIKLDDDNIIYLRSAIYFEKIKIKFPGHNNISLRIIGDDKEKTIISNNDFAKKIHFDGQEFNTFRTYTVMLLGNNISIENITIENTSGDGSKFGQAVALATIGNNIVIKNCNLIAHQDTLFLGPLPKDLLKRYVNFLPEDELIYSQKHQVFCFNTYVEGDVDYIFGGAEAYFLNCEFHSHNKLGYVFAPSTEQDEEEGFVVKDCCFTSTADKELVYLARPWRDNGKVVIINSLMNNHIFNEGFDKWNDTDRDKTCRFWEFHNEYYDKHEYKRCLFVKELDNNMLRKYEKKFKLFE